MVNRFIVQAVAGIPLTVYGKGGQTRGYLNLRDTLQCVDLAAANPPIAGELRILNQFTETFSVNELAERVQRVGNALGLAVQVKSIENPRRELEDHYYNPVHSGLLELGLKPHFMTDDVLAKMIETIFPSAGTSSLTAYSLASAGDSVMRHSVIRRSLGLVAIVLLGHCFNYLFVLLANRSGDAATFGRFYAAWATINVLGTPSAVFALLLTRYYAEAALSNSELSVWNALKHAGRVLTPWVIGAAVVVEIGLLLAGASVSDSIDLIAVLPLIAAVGFGIEAVRAAYAATHHPYLFAGFFSFVAYWNALSG